MFLPFSQRAKKWEPKAQELRRAASVGPQDLLDPWLLAPKIGLVVAEVTTALLNALPDDHRNHLLDGASHKWSGGVLPLPLPDGKRVCILNPTHSRERNKMTLMEEICHVHLRHTPTCLTFNAAGLKVRDFNSEQEAEAFGVGSAALLPWATFFQCVNEGHTIEEVATRFQVSEQLAEYRVKITGAYKLYAARQREAGMASKR